MKLYKCKGTFSHYFSLLYPTVFFVEHHLKFHVNTMFYSKDKNPVNFLILGDKKNSGITTSFCCDHTDQNLIFSTTSTHYLALVHICLVFIIISVWYYICLILINQTQAFAS